MNPNPAMDVFVSEGDDSIAIFGLYTRNDDIVCERGRPNTQRSEAKPRPFIRMPLSLVPQDRPPAPPKKPERKAREERRAGGVSTVGYVFRWMAALLTAAAVISFTKGFW